MKSGSHYFKSQIGNVRPKRGGAKLHRSIFGLLFSSSSKCDKKHSTK